MKQLKWLKNPEEKCPSCGMFKMIYDDKRHEAKCGNCGARYETQ